jgi:hypothetical protein
LRVDARDPNLRRAALTNVISRSMQRAAILVSLIGVLALTSCGGDQHSTQPSLSPLATVAVSGSPGSPTPTTTVVASGFSQRTELPLPEAREETAAAATSDTLVVAGGFDIGGRDRAEVFLLTNGVWRHGPPLPLAVDHPSAAALGDTVYVAGGFSAGVARAAVESLTPGATTWIALPHLAHQRGALALLAFAGRLYAVGGKVGSGAEVSAVESWAPGDALWRQEMPLPAPRDHVAGFVEPDRLCIAGGRSPATARVDCLDSSGAWVSAPALPAPTSGAAAGAVANAVIVAGGQDAAETRLNGQVDTLTETAWTAVPMLEPRHGMQGVLFNSRIWLCGGGTAPGLHPTAICTSVGPG